jgi:hypothetical protein
MLGYKRACMAIYDNSKAFRQILIGEEGVTKNLLRRMGIRHKEHNRASRKSIRFQFQFDPSLPTG